MSDRESIDTAWSLYVQTLPDRNELSVYQLARSKELFEAGWMAAFANKGSSVSGPASGEE